jgi:parvulin-like peptidyl-prolyl isomerase
LGTRTVRLDEEAEKSLEEIRRSTGLSVSAALKKGLIVLREEVARKASTTPYEIYSQLDLGPGGYAASPSDQTGEALRDAIKRKLGR